MGTMTATLACGHMTRVPSATVLPDVATCPVTGYERDITAISGEDDQ